ncbi:natural product biosynthesis luciferase-like monooxygenase domain protein [Rubidibacter lacunae KORDI 51-2]|uniref:Natural product biosynthesis luciferase-like monooxygenase domain protein n=1 Tax=Rubidibacter lacunae KORDI 51-2 TaxID=582515 RepID=U5DQZ9_9CHRO|nr:type I polyketide synthase [Rubidibacter lacunae]ERN42090.1 natural product biosynthesis luciferase-like monooxygenase domain protein [Rubidibacter lacunae KORDI 51-2]
MATTDLTPLQKAMLLVKKLQHEQNVANRARTEPIAIVGMGCRFPGGAVDPDAYWQLLQQGTDAITEVPSDRWSLDHFYDPDVNAPGKMYVRNGGFVDGLQEFDADFFGITPREAQSLDPQQRLLLEVVWEALETANLPTTALTNTPTGVYIGICTNDYSQHLMQRGFEGIDAYLSTGNSHSTAAGRLSYLLGLTGPCLSVDTACSSSLVAVHLACTSLRNGESDVALAAGVNRIFSPINTINFCKARMMAADGRCKTFDISADGFGRGEGCGVLVLKRLSDAQRDGDNILALLRGSAINQDGHTSGLTVPNGPSQQEVIRQALKSGNLNPSEIGYVEAHGTGTSLGDPIEMGALGAVFGPQRTDATPLHVGSAKTNIGHLEGAAGIAGLIKVVLQLQHEEIAPHLHLQNPNPYIDWDQFPVEIPTKAIPWPRSESPRLAGVSSFGFSGTNAHVILEEAPLRETPEAEAPKRSQQLLTLSAKGPTALEAQVKQYVEYLEALPTDDLAAACYYSRTGRTHFESRLALVGHDTNDFLEQLRAWQLGDKSTPAAIGKDIAMLFTGQGSQYLEMGRELYETQPTFKQALDRCDEILQYSLEQSLLEILYPADRAAADAALLNQTGYTQPALFAIEYALCQLWLSWGIQPQVVMGHSVGEYVAACIAGVFSLEDGLKLIAARGRLMQQLPVGGTMVSTLAPVETVRSTIGEQPGVAIAAINGPQSTVISGATEAVRPIVEKLSAQGIKTIELNVSHAFHSPLMQPMLGEFEAVAQQISYATPKLKFVSNVSGEVAGDDVATHEYWVKHVLASVNFAGGMATLQKLGVKCFLECGPKPILLGMGRQCLPTDDGLWLPSLRPNQSGQLLQSLSELYAAGVAADWQAFDRNQPLQRAISLPTYPFQRQHHWLAAEPIAPATPAALPSLEHPLLGTRLPASAHRPGELTWERSLDLNTLPGLRGYRAEGTSVLSTGAYLDMALAAARIAWGEGNRQVEDLQLSKPLFVTGERRRVLQAVWIAGEDGSAQFQVHSRELEAATDWTLHATANVRSAPTELVAAVPTFPHSVAQSQNVKIQRGLNFGIMYFASGEVDLASNRYRLVMEGSRSVDRNGFSRIWIPERHYTALGCLYPNPAVLHAALARETQQIRLQAGSVVMPIHHPLQVAEEWAMVDNLSGGRVGVSFASGWNPADFATAPDSYSERWERLVDGIQTVRRLWRGETIEVLGGDGEMHEIRSYPTPVQPELPVWMTAVGNPRTCITAGKIGANLLTHLFDQNIDALAEKIALYREARADAGYDPATGNVTVTLPTFIGADFDTVCEQVRQPYCDYIRAYIPFLSGLSYSRGSQVDLTALSEEDMDQATAMVFERLVRDRRVLLGTPETCFPLVQELAKIGVNELGCLLDFGPHPDLVLEALPHLNRLREACESLDVVLPSAAVRSTENRATPIAIQSPTAVALTPLQQRCTAAMAGPDYYQQLATLGVEVDGEGRGIQELWRGQGEAIARLQLPDGAQPAAANDLPAALLEACLQVCWAALPAAEFMHAGAPRYLGVGVGRVRVYGALPAEVWSHATLLLTDDRQNLTGEVSIFAPDGTVLLKVEGLQFQQVAPGTEAPESDLLAQLRADFLPAPVALGAWVRERTIALEQLSKLEFYRQLLPALAELSRGYCLTALAQMGVGLSMGQRHTAAELDRQCQIVPEHQRLWQRVLQILQEAGALARDGDTWEVRQAPGKTDPEQALQALRKIYPACDAELQLLGKCGGALAAVLQGRQSALELLFSEGSLANLEALYRHSPAAKIANQWVQDAVAKALETLPVDRPLRILEIGAGTGGTTASMLSLLPRDRSEYAFTDVSHLFVAQAEQKFKDYPFLDYRVLDIERSPHEQGLEAYHYDIVLAANVLHATADMRRTLGHVRQLLVPDGLLVLLEGMQPQAWVDLIFGMTPGWWAFADADLRPDYPLLTYHQWKEILPEIGFPAVEIMTAAAPDSPLAQQGMVLARVADPDAADVAALRRPQEASTCPATTAGKQTVPAAAVGAVQQEMLALAPEARLPVLVTYVRTEAASVMGITPAERLDCERSLFELGMDSLMALELKNRLESNLSCKIPAVAAFEYPTITALAGYLATDILGWQLAALEIPPLAEPQDEPVDAMTRIDRLSDDEVDRLFAEKFARSDRNE